MMEATASWAGKNAFGANTRNSTAPRRTQWKITGRPMDIIDDREVIYLIDMFGINFWLLSSSHRRLPRTRLLLACPYDGTRDEDLRGVWCGVCFYVRCVLCVSACDLDMLVQKRFALPLPIALLQQHSTQQTSHQHIFLVCWVLGITGNRALDAPSRVANDIARRCGFSIRIFASRNLLWSMVINWIGLA